MGTFSLFLQKAELKFNFQISYKKNISHFEVNVIKQKLILLMIE